MNVFTDLRKISDYFHRCLQFQGLHFGIFVVFEEKNESKKNSILGLDSKAHCCFKSNMVPVNDLCTTNIKEIMFFNDKYKLLVVKLIFPLKKIKQSTSPTSIDEYVEIIKPDVMIRVRIPKEIYIVISSI